MFCRHHFVDQSHCLRLLVTLKVLSLQGDVQHAFRIFAGLAILFEDTVGTAHSLLEEVRWISLARMLQEACNDAVGAYVSAASAL